MSDQTINEEEIKNTEEASFGIQDLIFTAQVFEACAQRGAFRADELTNVGTVYDRLKKFLIANGVVPNSTESTDSSEQTNTGDE